MIAARRPTLRANRGTVASRPIELVPRAYVVVATTPTGPPRGAVEIIREPRARVEARAR